MQINNKRKSSISIKQLISEFGESFPESVREKLTELESRCFLRRKSALNVLDLLHVEHVQFECDSSQHATSSKAMKEYSYGQFVIIDGSLYFSENCIESSEIVQAPNVSRIFNFLDSEAATVHDQKGLKKLDDNNIDYVIDSILSICPKVSQSYLDIVSGMRSRAEAR